MNLKKLLSVCAFVPCNLFASTTISFSNNSEQEYNVSSRILDTQTNIVAGRDYQITDAVSVDAYRSNVPALTFNSDINIKNGVQYHFNVTIQNNRYPSQNLNFYITTQGLLIGSQIIETKLILPSGENISLNPKQNTSFSIPEWDNILIHFVPYQQNENGMGPSFALTADQKTGNSFDFSTANTFKAINYNVQLFPFYADISVPPNNKNERAHRIPNLIGGEYDYVSFNEVFDRDLREQIIRDMQKDYPYIVDSTLGVSNPNVLSGGIVTFSKWPVMQVKQLVYQACALPECLSNKGVTYVKVQKKIHGIAQIYHVFATHLQSVNSPLQTQPYNQPRTKQIRELRDFIQAQHIPFSEPVLIAGDFNVDKYGQNLEDYRNQSLQTEYDYLLSTLNAMAPVQTGLKYSFDGMLNTMLGLSSHSQFQIDYVLYSKDHQSPAYALNRIQTMRDTSNPLLYPFYDTSDHFPVIGEFVFADVR